MRENMKKKLFAAALTALMTASIGMTSFAAGWQNDANGWWYTTDDTGSSWYKNGWQWIDGNGDSLAECYYFDANGYCLMDTTTPDGYTVNADGAWTIDGIVQISNTKVQGEQTEIPQFDGLYCDVTWNNTLYYLRTLEDGSLQVLFTNADGTPKSEYFTMAYKGNNHWSDGDDIYSIQAWITDRGVRISMGGYMQRELVDASTVAR